MLTALKYFITPVDLIKHRGGNIPVPIPTAESVSYTLCIKRWLSDVLFGAADPDGWTQNI